MQIYIDVFITHAQDVTLSEPDLDLDGSSTGRLSTGEIQTVDLFSLLF